MYADTNTTLLKKAELQSDTNKLELTRSTHIHLLSSLLWHSSLELSSTISERDIYVYIYIYIYIYI